MESNTPRLAKTPCFFNPRVAGAMGSLTGALLLAGCGTASDSRLLNAEMPLHLEDHLVSALIEESSVPETAPEAVEWRFDEIQLGWRTVAARGAEPVEPVRVDDALRLALTKENPHPENPKRLEGYVFVEVPDWQLEDWGYVEIRARASRGMRRLGLMFNYTEDDPQGEDLPFFSFGERTWLDSDGGEHTYRLRLDSKRKLSGPWTDLGIHFNTVTETEAENLEILSVRVVPVEAEYASEAVGVRSTRLPAAVGDEPQRRVLFSHAPGKLAYRVRLPAAARLDVGLGVLSDEAPISFAIEVTPSAGATSRVLETTWSDPGSWAQSSVDLSGFAGQVVTLSLSAEAEREGSVALWAAPTISGTRVTERPNVIFYVIDTAGSDFMSAYDYPRRTTPYLEELVKEGVLFERAYSSASWTGSSTAAFLTSLHHSVLGGERHGYNPVPDEAVTMAEHFHRAGYQTAHLTTNPNAGRKNHLDRGADFSRETHVEQMHESSESLHRSFWEWREAYPGEPFFVHFQTTDVHEPHAPPSPFSGRFIDARERAQVEELEKVLEESDLWARRAQEKMGSDWTRYATGKRDMYDEAMAYQDDQIRRLVERLRDEGLWENTLLVIASDHGSAAGSQDWQTLMLDPVPEAHDFSQRGTPMLRSGVSAVPLIFVWPGHLGPPRRLDQPVSMIDVLPTLLDLVNLPPPQVSQGRSLVPLLRGADEWTPHPVILDEFKVDAATGELAGRIEVIDGRWGASLAIGPGADPEDPGDQRPAPLLLCDLLADPLCVDSVHEEHPELVEKYTRFLERQFRAHRDMAQLFTRPADSPLTSEQLETLRSLGYIQ